MQIKKDVGQQKVMSLKIGSDGILRYQGRLCVLDVDGLRKRILDEAHMSRYVVHPSSTKMHQHLKTIYWWNNMKCDVANYVAKCLNCQQVKVKHLRPGGTSQEISLPLWKWEMINMDFIMGLSRS